MNLMISIFLTSVLFASLFASHKAFADSSAKEDQANFNFCQRQFGKEARIRFEPDKSNEVGVADTFNGRGSFPSKKPDVPKPKRFRCLVKPINSYEGQSPAECPSHLKPEFIGKTRWCGSKPFELENLCPDGLKYTWPELAPTVCSKSKREAR
ncbi:MAG TPA: hypothetical protein PLZ57_12290 [Pseudobdellovibrionaceae bacterium]|nr:hypothetical protein [Pseudobdellovibrionaceae bacterium]